MAGQTIYIVYSNSTTFWGRLAYGVRRMSAATPGTPCAALELTHGGSDSKERPEWLQAKQQIPVDLKQLHYDEIPEDLKHYIESNKYEYPCVVGKTSNGRFHMLLADSEIGDFAGQPVKFAKAVQTSAVEAGIIWK